MPDNNRPNYFIRFSIVFYIITLLILVWLSFINSQSPYIISTGIITVLLLITILILSESFDSFSLGKILSISREVRQKDKEISEVKKENSELRNNIIQMSTIISQKQNQNVSTNNYHGITPDVLRLVGVTKAIEKTSDEDDELSKVEKSITEKQIESSTNDEPVKIYQIRNFVAEESIKLYFSKNQLNKEELIREAQFTSVFAGLDPIAERNIVYDAYLKTNLKEFFFEVEFDKLSPMIFDKIYIRLSKIMFYRQAKSVQAEMVLILANIPELADNSFRIKDRLLSIFKPAIDNELLRIETISFSNVDLQRWKSLLENKGKE